MRNDKTVRYPVDALRTFARELLERAGVRNDITRDTAEVLLDGDLLGHTTHGLALLAPYLEELDNGRMTKSGEPSVRSSRPAAQIWDGHRLPGPWLTLRALDAAMTMARQCGTGTVVVARLRYAARQAM